jgi:hypothetical protein
MNWDELTGEEICSNYWRGVAAGEEPARQLNNGER